MDISREHLYEMGMNYFGGLRWGHFNHLPRCAVWIDQRFDFYALNYCHAGRIRWGMNGGPLRTLTAPVAWWTWPGPRFAYGNLPGETWDHYYVVLHGARPARGAHSPTMHAGRRVVLSRTV